METKQKCHAELVSASYKKNIRSMKKKNILKLLITTILIAICSTKANAAVEGKMLLLVEDPPTASITVDSSASTSSTSVTSIETGAIGTLVTVFNLETNGTDENFDFVITSSITYDGGSESAYDSSGNILFVNTNASSMPDAAAVSQAKSRSGNNFNVISYPVTITQSSPFTSDYQANYKTYGNSYVIKVNGGTSGNVRHTVGPTPVSGTYSNVGDEKGTYQATITMSAVAL